MVWERQGIWAAEARCSLTRGAASRLCAGPGGGCARARATPTASRARTSQTTTSTRSTCARSSDMQRRHSSEAGCFVTRGRTCGSVYSLFSVLWLLSACFPYYPSCWGGLCCCRDGYVVGGKFAMFYLRRPRLHPLGSLARWQRALLIMALPAHTVLAAGSRGRPIPLGS